MKYYLSFISANWAGEMDVEETTIITSDDIALLNEYKKNMVMI